MAWLCFSGLEILDGVTRDGCARILLSSGAVGAKLCVAIFCISGDDRAVIELWTGWLWMVDRETGCG